MNHKLYLNHKGFEPFNDFSYGWIMAENGLFLAKDNPAFRAVIPVQLSELGVVPIQGYLELKDHIKISFKEAYRAVQFFRFISRTKKTEAYLDITYNQETYAVEFFCPKQYSTGGSVHVEEVYNLPDCLIKIGSFHSHPCEAFHSHGDQQDEIYSDGLHIVAGDLENEIPSFVASLVVKGYRQEVDPKQIIEWGFEFNKDWSDFVQNK
jgi:proteasome lid subunit RPN8/RPN11